MDDAASVLQHEGEDSPAGTVSSAPDKYLSCRFIERGLVFQPMRSISPCCGNPAGHGHPVLASYDGSGFSFDAVLEARSRIIARHRSGDVEPACRGCPKLQEADWAATMSPFAVDEVTIAPFSSCNIRCNYCYTMVEGPWTSPLSRAPRVLPVFQALIDRKQLDPNATIRFSGGEPTLSPEFEPLLTLLTEYGARCVIYTNATKRSDAIMEALRRDKVELILGIDAASVAVYKAIKKMNYFDKVWKVVADYCAAVQPGAVNKVWAKFIFCGENYQEAAQFVRCAADAGAKHIYYGLDTSRNPGRLRQDLGPLPDAVTDHIAIFRHECRKRGMVAQFAHTSVPWLTPERSARIEREFERLNRAEPAAAL